jgi:mono/diheme cytochrome c family protein
MTALRNPLLMALCLVLLANLLFNSPDRSDAPHGRRGRARGHADAAPTARAGNDSRGGNAEFGQMLFASNCTACHGPRGHGLPRQGVNLRESKFVAEQSDGELIAFLRRGRAPSDATSQMGMLMPPRGGNRTLDDAALEDVVAFLRELQGEARQEAGAAAAAAAATPTASGDASTAR